MILYDDLSKIPELIPIMPQGAMYMMVSRTLYGLLLKCSMIGYYVICYLSIGWHQHVNV